MPDSTRRVVTGHDARGRSVVLSDGSPPQHHPMHGLGVGADFHEMWSESDTIPELAEVDWPASHAVPHRRYQILGLRPTQHWRISS
jgi:hypothetical protein